MAGPVARERSSPSAKSRQSRSRSTDDRLKGADPMKRALKENGRRRSTGSLGAVQSVLRVKTQYDSLKKHGLSRTRQRNKVEFSFLEVREYPMIVGDNPSCTDGPPVTLDWAFDPTTQFVLDLNTFEEMRGPRRVHKEMLMPRSVREKSLMEIGFTKQDIANVMRQVRKDKHSRMVSSQQLGMDNIHEAKEKVTTGIKKMFVFKKSEYEKSLKIACSTQPVA